MEAARIGTVFGEVPLYFARDALALEHSIVVNRIKPHTKFIGPAESGILKMLCIGMGKHLGAVAYHTWAMKYGFFPLLKEMGERSPPTVISASAWPWRILRQGAPHQRGPRRPGFRRRGRFNALGPRPTSRGCRSGSWMSWWWSGSEGDQRRWHGPERHGPGLRPDESDFSGILKAARVHLNLSAGTGGNAIGPATLIITEKVFQALDYERP
jgi:hypothetical protein